MTESDWWALCDLDPAAFPWPCFADFLEERRDPRTDAAREVGRRGWLPCRALNTRGPAGTSWDWYAESYHWPDTPHGSILPDGLVNAMHDDLGVFDEVCAEFRTAARACRALLDALARALPR
jgi:hypothetical protein